MTPRSPQIKRIRFSFALATLWRFCRPLPAVNWFGCLVCGRVPVLSDLTPDERLRYKWQLWVRDFGEEQQRQLKGASVLVSRIGGVGGTAAMQLAAAGIGRLVLAHAGNLRLDDLNRQLLMTTDRIGKPRIESAVRTLQALNPLVQVETIAENISEQNVIALVERCDVVASAAPLFSERL